MFLDVWKLCMLMKNLVRGLIDGVDGDGLETEVGVEDEEVEKSGLKAEVGVGIDGIETEVGVEDEEVDKSGSKAEVGVGIDGIEKFQF